MRWIVVLLVMASGSAIGAPVGTTIVIDRSVARVGDEVIWQRDVESRAKSVEEHARPAVLDEMIDEALILVEARRAGVTVERSEVQSAVEEVKKQNNLDDQALEAALVDVGYTRARYEVEIERQIMRLRAQYQLVSPRVDVTDAQIAAEAKARKLKLPLDEAARSALHTELRRKALEAETAKWIGELRKRAWIEKRS